MPDADPTESPAIKRLRRLALTVVAAGLLTAGGWKLYRPDSGITMLSRYLQTPKAIRAAGCLELALALWLVSGRNPKLAPGVAAATLLGLAVLVGGELRRDHPLPSGSFPHRGALLDSAAVRRELSVALGRDAFLAALGLLAAVTAPSQAENDAA
ncbi:MAG: hypothetical protein QM754_20105 [Tepidisphaeraceae bacterium]